MLHWPYLSAVVLLPKSIVYYQQGRVHLHGRRTWLTIWLLFSALTDISKSISLYLNDEKSIYRVLAIDLCSRGFNVWQHYIDAMEILRSLVDLATNVRKDSITLQNISAQARLAVLSIASNNMPLLMGTLSLDILSPPSIEHQRSVLQILAFLIRKVLSFFLCLTTLVSDHHLVATLHFISAPSSSDGSSREVTGPQRDFQSGTSTGHRY